VFRLGLLKDQVDVAIGYIEVHKQEVIAQYEKIMERINRGNPPEIQAKLNAVHGIARAKAMELCRSKYQESGDEGHPGYRSFSRHRPDLRTLI
jgi:hypothetical protein